MKKTLEEEFIFFLQKSIMMYLLDRNYILVLSATPHLQNFRARVLNTLVNLLNILEVLNNFNLLEGSGLLPRFFCLVKLRPEGR